jgi:hypothetical protein
MGFTIWFNVVNVDSTQINLVIQVIISQGIIATIAIEAKNELCHNRHPIDVFLPLAITKYLNVYTNIAYTQFLSFIKFLTSKTIITCIQFSSCNPFRVGFRTWILHPSQQRCGGIPPSPPGLRNVGLRPPVLALLGSSWRRVPSRAAAKRSACARGRLVVVVVFCSENSMASRRKKGYERTHY